jgi:hypothetical protein
MNEPLDYHTRQSQEIVTMRTLLALTYEFLPAEIALHHVPQAYRSLLLADLRKAEPASVDKFIELSIRHS